MAVGPSGNPSRTKVARRPYWVPFDNDGKGGWRFLASDLAHRQQRETADEAGTGVVTSGVYESKGYIPLARIEDGDARRELLPKNWQEMCRDHKAVPQMPEKAKAKADAA